MASKAVRGKILPVASQRNIGAAERFRRRFNRPESVAGARTRIRRNGELRTQVSLRSARRCSRPTQETAGYLPGQKCQKNVQIHGQIPTLHPQPELVSLRVTIFRFLSHNLKLASPHSQTGADARHLPTWPGPPPTRAGPKSRSTARKQALGPVARKPARQGPEKPLAASRAQRWITPPD